MMSLRVPAFLLALGLSAGGVHAAAPVWTGTWSAPVLDQQLFNNSGQPVALGGKTVRQSFRSSIGGSQVRVRLSNLFGQQAVTVRDVHFAKAASDQAVKKSTDQVLLFGGKGSVTIQPGQQVTSDALGFKLARSTDYAVSLYVPDAVDFNHVTAHRQAWQTIYTAAGDVAADPGITPVDSIGSYVFLTGVEVVDASATGAVVTLGASITDGSNTSYGANLRWGNDLALRLHDAGLEVGVLNAGLSGGQLLNDGSFGGPSALNRFQRDVLSQAGVKWVISSDTAINDLSGHSNGHGQTDGSGPSFAQLSGATQQLIAQAHAAGVTFLCSTLTPNVGRDPNSWTPTAESIREQLNAWYRTPESGCDGIVDQDTATHDPAMPLQYRPSFNAGDFLHPNDAGTQAIADAINLGFFEKNGLPPVAASTSCGTLLPGEGLRKKQSLLSCDGRFQLALQADSNLVLSFGATVLWSTNTAGQHASEFTLLPDGDAVLYGSDAGVLFDTKTTGLLSTRLVVQNDGNMVVYDGAGHPLFATNTCCH